MSARLLGPTDEPQESGALVVVHAGDYRSQEVWVRSGANIGNWYPLGGEFGVPRVPLHPHWSDVLARGSVVLLAPIGEDGYRAGWRAGRRDLWQAMEEVADEDPAEVRRG